MDRIIFGDNQFFAVNHVSDEKARAQSIKFRDDRSILKILDEARAAGINTFMCTTHDRMGGICDNIRADKDKYEKFNVFPCMPYAHKYANAVAELGIIATIKQYMPGNMIGSLFKGGVAYLSKDYISIMELLVEAEMKMFNGIDTPVIFLQNVVTDLLLGLGMTNILSAFHNFVRRKYNAEAGFISMNLPKLLICLEREGIKNPIICTSINKIGFRMAGGKAEYEHVLRSKKARVIAMQVMAGGAIPAWEAVRYICRLPNVESVLFGASSKANIEETVSLIRDSDESIETPNLKNIAI